MNEEHQHHCDNDEKIRTDIEKYGLSVILIEATDYLPSFAYSIGLWQKYQHPEIICFGLSTRTLHIIINDVARIVKEGALIQEGKVYDNIFKNSSAVFIPVDKRNLGDYFGAAIGFYNSKDFSALQLVWTDRNDKFPWENDFEDIFTYKQPLLDRNADFKFREAKNVGVFTTRQWLDLDKPILRVVHDTEGDWQFLTGDQVQDDARVVALEQLVIRDSTLNEVFDLGYGEAAEREFVGDQWTRSSAVYEDEDEEDYEDE